MIKIEVFHGGITQRELDTQPGQGSYILFNNITMYDNAWGSPACQIEGQVGQKDRR